MLGFALLFLAIFVTDWDLPWVNHHHEVITHHFGRRFFVQLFSIRIILTSKSKVSETLMKLGRDRWIDGELGFGKWGFSLIDLHPEGRCLPLKKVDKAQFSRENP